MGRAESVGTSKDDGISSPDLRSHRGRAFRVGQIALGLVLILVGIVMSGPGIPGPGLVVILAGLNLVKPNNRVYRWLRRKAPGLPDEGPLPRRHLIIGVFVAVLFTAISVFVTTRFGPSISSWLSNIALFAATT